MQEREVELGWSETAARKAVARHKKYTSEKMIVRDIDAARRKMVRLRDSAASMYAHAELLRDCESVEWRDYIEEADRRVAQADRIENTRLKKLANTLSTFRTSLLPVPGMGGPHAILEKL